MPTPHSEDNVAWTDMARQLELVGRFCRLVSQRHARYTLSRAEVAVLTHLELAGRGVTPGDVGRETGIGKEAMSRLARGLVERGLVERRPHPRDGRSVLLQVTPAGRFELGHMYEEALRPLYALLRGLGPDDYGRFMELMGRAGDILEDGGPSGGRAARRGCSLSDGLDPAMHAEGGR